MGKKTSAVKGLSGLALSHRRMHLSGSRPGIVLRPDRAGKKYRYDFELGYWMADSVLFLFLRWQTLVQRLHTDRSGQDYPIHMQT